jgi:hypothetical protein
MDIMTRIAEATMRIQEAAALMDRELLPGVRLVEPNLEADIAQSRFGLPLFERDPNYDIFSSEGFEPAFPPEDDLPETERISWDVWYLPDKKNYKRIHRITASRSHESLGGSNVVFVDGAILATKVHCQKLDFTTLYSLEAAVTDRKMTNLSFPVSGWNITLLTNTKDTVWRKLWFFFLQKSPNDWGIFSDDMNCESGDSLELSEKRGRKCCPGLLPMIILWPIWIVWMLLGFFVISCFVFLCSRCTVRRFRLSNANGFLRADSADASEREPLLFKGD